MNLSSKQIKKTTKSGIHDDFESILEDWIIFAYYIFLTLEKLDCHQEH